MTMRPATIVKKINKMFGADHADYPVAFLQCKEDGGRPLITSESPAADGMKVVDYYGEFRGHYPWVDPRLEKFLNKNGLYYEWENAACVGIYNQ